MSNHILIVDDEIAIRTSLGDYLLSHSYQVSYANNGEEMFTCLAENKISLVLLDINLPNEDGLMLARKLRSGSDVGIIIITARADSIDKIVGLEMGADDYCTKPLDLRQLQVRVRNLLWRISLSDKAKEQLSASSKDENNSVLYFNGWRFDIERRTLNRGSEPTRLTKAEYEILSAFVSYPGKVLDRNQILALLSHRVDEPNNRTVDVLVRRLRNKMEIEPKSPQLFVTVHGEGYMFAGVLKS